MMVVDDDGVVGVMVIAPRKRRKRRKEGLGEIYNSKQGFFFFVFLEASALPAFSFLISRTSW